MRNMLPKILILFLFVLTGCKPESNAASIEYEFLTPQVVVLKADFAPVNHSTVGLNIISEGIWVKEEGLLRDPDGTILRKADLTGFTYLVFGKPFKNGEMRNLHTIMLKYDPEIPSKIFKLNQLGNGVEQRRKYAYMGAWLGTAGALPLKHLAGKEFELRNSVDGSCVYRNTLRLRRDDPAYLNKTPFTGEEVLELDYSDFNTPGKYYFYVDGIGRSMDFLISSDTVSEAFYIHARGLYHKRCGIAKTQPYTAWECPACHSAVVRYGRFPGNAEHYRRGGGEKNSGFFDIKDNRIEVKHFELIKANPPYKNSIVSAPGGWHDAADYDRRPYHLRIVSDLATVYLMKPENFVDGQLNIPESGNGIPDILDEAAWGLKHLLAVQQPDGGVGTWFETTGHPGPGEGMPDKEERIYFVSAPGRNGTLEYAAAASTLAIAMKRADRPDEAAIYLASAKKAWDFAMNPKNRLVSWFRLNGKMISYMEEPVLYGRDLMRAGANLHALTGDVTYLEPVSEAEARILETFNKDFWKWSPLSLMTLELYPAGQLDAIRAEYRKVILRNADLMLRNQENAYPYRIPWFASDADWVHTMAWGNYHPLRRAVTLIAAHKLTGSEPYRVGAYLANDYHNGANPLGRSMTSGLGKVYPAVFLDLISYADGIGEFVPGITPYSNTFGIDRNAVKMAYQNRAEQLPVFRRAINLEFLSVSASEYSVWETISPAAVTSGYLIEKPVLLLPDWKNRKPAADYRTLPGYRALP